MWPTAIEPGIAHLLQGFGDAISAADDRKCPNAADEPLFHLSVLLGRDGLLILPYIDHAFDCLPVAQLSRQDGWRAQPDHCLSL
jgi:hypothetical protein